MQGWYNKLQRDEVVAEWKKVKGNMTLHVHCHISGGHFLLDMCARFRYFIFGKELPVVKFVNLFCSDHSESKCIHPLGLNKVVIESHVTNTGFEGLCSWRRQFVEQLP